MKGPILSTLGKPFWNVYKSIDDHHAGQGIQFFDFNTRGRTVLGLYEMQAVNYWSVKILTP